MSHHNPSKLFARAIGVSASRDWLHPSDNPQFSKLHLLRKRFEGYKHSNLHLARKYSRIFNYGHMFLKARSFPRATLSENCPLLRTSNIRAYLRAGWTLLLIDCIEIFNEKNPIKMYWVSLFIIPALTKDSRPLRVITPYLTHDTVKLTPAWTKMLKCHHLTPVVIRVFSYTVHRVQTARNNPSMRGATLRNITVMLRAQQVDLSRAHPRTVPRHPVNERISSGHSPLS